MDKDLDIQTIPLGFTSLSSEKVSLMLERMIPITRAMQSFGRSDSQVSRKLMTLTMLSPCSPYRTLRQIIAQIEKKKLALCEAIGQTKLNENTIKKLEKEAANEDGQIEKERCEIEIAIMKNRMAEQKIYIDGAIKEIGALQTAYFEICKNKGIKENWDEADFESAEIDHHIKSAFRIAIRDVVATGRLSVAAQEYFEQVGINPITGLAHVNLYLTKCSETRDPTFENLMEFLDACAEKFKDSHLEVMKRLGIDTLIDQDWLYRES